MRVGLRPRVLPPALPPLPLFFPLSCPTSSLPACIEDLPPPAAAPPCHRGREGYQPLFNTDMHGELGSAARFLHMAADYARRSGFKGQLLLEPKPQARRPGRRRRAGAAGLHLRGGLRRRLPCSAPAQEPTKNQVRAGSPPHPSSHAPAPRARREQQSGRSCPSTVCPAASKRPALS